MPDAWEKANGFNPNDAADGARVASAEGYTALEIYLNSLMGELIDIVPTGIQNLQAAAQSEMASGWFTMQGIRLNQKPAIAGLYISNGKKLLVK
jgi:hypothetical protein